MENHYTVYKLTDPDGKVYIGVTGKTVEESYCLLRHLDLFQTFRLPVLAGLSRKSMFFKPLGITPMQALNATTAGNMLALERGASILRVHDVCEAQQAVQIYCLTHQND